MLERSMPERLVRVLTLPAVTVTAIFVDRVSQLHPWA